MSRNSEALAEFGVVFALFSVELLLTSAITCDASSDSWPWYRASCSLHSCRVCIAMAGRTKPLSGLYHRRRFCTVLFHYYRQAIGRAGEDATPRRSTFGLAISVFQDVTAVPFLILIPVLGTVTGMDALARELVWASAKAVLAFAVVFYAVRWALHPLFQIVAGVPPNYLRSQSCWWCWRRHGQPIAWDCPWHSLPF